MIPASIPFFRRTKRLDDDLLLVAAVFADDVTPEQLTEFDRRYVEDAEWRARILPFVDLFLLPVNWSSLADQLNSAADVRQQEQTQARERRNWRILFTMKIAATMAGIAILGATAIQIGAVTWLFDEGPDRVVGMSPVHRPNGGATPAPTGAGRRAGAVGTPSPAMKAKSGAPVQPDSSRASSAALTILDIQGRTATADSANSIILELPGGSRVRVRPGSTVRYASLPGIAHTSILELRGELAIVVAKADGVVGVVSRAGRATLFPGSYALRCVAACKALEVTVQEGSAIIANDWQPGTKLTVDDGEFAQAFRDAPPLKATGARCREVSSS